MDVWRVALYGGAFVLALRALTSLMTTYRNRALRQFEHEQALAEQARAKEKADRVAAEKAAKKQRVAMR